MSTSTGERFANLDELETEHASLLDDLDRACADETVVSDSESERRFVTDNRERILGFIAKGARTGALLHGLQERRPAQQILDRWAACLFRVGIKDAPPATLAPFDASAAPDLHDVPCPYVGLEPFRENQETRFFGRSERTADLVAAVRTRTFVIVTGASGSGKSSLMLAGLVPALRNDAIPGSSAWTILPAMVPGTSPLRTLAHQLGAAFPAVDADALCEALRTQPERLREVLDANSPAPCLLVIDQLEEVFTLRSTEAAGESAAFLAALVALARSPDCRHRIVATFRKDREGDLAASADLQQIYFDRPFIVSSMLPDQLRAAIEGPAAQAGLVIEPDVVESLVNTFTGDETGLPLLQYCLVELWQRRSRNRVTRKTLAELGDPKHAMAQVADEIYGNLAVQGQAAAKVIFLRLAHKVEGQEFLRARKRRSELWSAVGNKLTADDVIGRFADRRLLKVSPSSSGDPQDDVIEVAHEALLRNWNEFRKWVVEEGARLDQRAFISRQAALWADSAAKQAEPGQYDATGLLLSGIALRQAMADIYADFPESSLERRFLEASEKKASWIDGELARAADTAQKEAAWAKASARRKTYGIAAALVALGIIAVLAGMLFVQSEALEEKRDELLAQRVAASALAACETNPGLARRLASRAFEIGAQRPGAVRDAVSAAICLIRSPSTGYAPAATAEVDLAAFAMSADGQRIVVGSKNGYIREYDLTANSARPSDAFATDSQGTRLAFIPVSTVAYSPDAEFVAAGAGSGVADVSGKGSYCGGEARCGTLALLARSPLPAVGGSDTPTAIVALLDATDAIVHVAFSADGGRLAVVSDDGSTAGPEGRRAARLEIWDRADLLARRTFASPRLRERIEGGVARLAPGNDQGTFIAVTGLGHTLRVAPEDGRYVVRREPALDCEVKAAISVDGSRQVVARPSRTCLALRGEERSGPAIEDGNVLDAVLRSRGDLLVTLTVPQEEGSDIVIRNLRLGERPTVLRKAYATRGAEACAGASEHTAGCDLDASVQTSQDGTVVAIGPSATAALTVYRFSREGERDTWAWLRQPSANLAFSADDRSFAVLAPAQADRQAWEYRTFALRSGGPVRRVTLQGFKGDPLLRMIDSDGQRFAVTDENGSRVYRVEGDRAVSELAIEADADVDFNESAGTLRVIRRNPETGRGASCEVYRIDAPAQPVWAARRDFAACQLSDDATMAALETRENGKRTVRLQRLGSRASGEPATIRGLPDEAQYFLSSPDARHVLVAEPAASTPEQSHVKVYALRDGSLAEVGEYVGANPVANVDAPQVFAVDRGSNTLLVVEGDNRVAYRPLGNPKDARYIAASAVDPTGAYALVSGARKASLRKLDQSGTSLEIPPGSKVQFGPGTAFAVTSLGRRLSIHDLARAISLADVPFAVEQFRFSPRGTRLVLETTGDAYVVPLELQEVTDLMRGGSPLTAAEKCSFENDAEACRRAGAGAAAAQGAAPKDTTR